MMTRSHYVGSMARPYPVHEAKAKLSEILRRVKQGRSVTISERGREIARVIPVEAPRSLEARLHTFEHEGVIVRGTGDTKMIRSVGRKRGALRRFLQSRS
jgi:prevent-host-death family protein